MQEIGVRITASGAEDAASGIAKIGSALDTLSGTVGSAISTVKHLSEALGVGFSVKWAADLVKSSIEASAALADLSYKTGATVESLSSFEVVGRLSNTSIDQVGQAMNRLAKNMAVSNEASKGTAEAIKALGLDFNAFAALSPDEKMYALAEALNKFEDGSAKSAVAMTLMGKSGAELLPFMKELAERGHVAATTTLEQAEAAKAFSDEMEMSRMRLELVERQLAMAMIPTLTSMRELLLDAGLALRDYLAPGLDEGAAKFGALKPVITAVGTALEAITVLGANVGFVFQGIGRDIGAMAAQLVALAHGDIAGFTAIHEAAIADAAKARAELDRFSASFLGLTQRVLDGNKATGVWANLTAEQAKRLHDLSGAGVEAERQQLKFNTAVGESTKAYASLLDQLDKQSRVTQTRLAESAQELASNRKLTDAEKEYTAAMALVSQGKVKLTDLIKNGTLARMAENMRVAEHQQALEAEKKTMQDG